MREIIFKGKRRDCEEWVYGYIMQDPFHGMVIVPPRPDNRSDFTVYPVIPETIGQYTGLTDKNGTKIFEGDILMKKRRFSGDSLLGTVSYGEWNCICCYGVFGYSVSKGSLDLRDVDEAEVIGNIHNKKEREHEYSE